MASAHEGSAMNPLSDDSDHTSCRTAAPRTGERCAPGVREVAEGDLPQLLRLDRAVFQGAAYPFFVMRQLFDVHREHLLVLEGPGGEERGEGRGEEYGEGPGNGTAPGGPHLVGYVLAGVVPGGKDAWILGLGVEPAERGHGHGRRLLRAGLARLTDHGVGEVRLSVEPANHAAIRLYRSFGFTEAGRRDDYFGPQEDRLLMSLLLR
ncbi:GNAT family N-acetyltransferase [Streptomyces syringium]|uniref:GNAT family N-acetyltransferase n=1 Tax=Streptomyces syringium TaxID=76729 RepID=UPI003666562E